ncbi:hypothetical protein T4C_8234 [Trichinella pseudospiralis]|uniref:Uncharacterized protein n=1 Tax=Trichinella pseudospiralis TaxID=6337 RepID=A0A0V1IMP6_TRIPS|nr:hypothetical protein T4C_8234 [Trichinella pseudospiralis]
MCVKLQSAHIHHSTVYVIHVVIDMSPFDATVLQSIYSSNDINIERYALKINEMILYAYLLNRYVCLFLF